MKPDHNHVPHAEESLPGVLARVVTELNDVAHLIERIEPQLMSEEPVCADRVRVLQGIDLAVQKTRGLAEFLHTIAASIPDTCLVDVATAVNLIELGDMKRALGTSVANHGRSPPLTKAAGEFEAF